MKKIKLDLCDSQIVRLKIIKGFRDDNLDYLIDYIIDYTYETCELDCDDPDKLFDENYNKLKLLKSICKKYGIDNDYFIDKFQNNLELDENDELLKKFSSKDKDIVINILTELEEEI